MSVQEMSKKPADLDQRDPAMKNLDENMIVLAGAGAGKTTILINRLLLLILGKGIPVEKIVALTFTKKAAEEMRERLDDRLKEICEKKELEPFIEEAFPKIREVWLERAQLARENLPRAKMTTLHAFASDLLRLYPLQGGVDPKFRPDEGLAYDLLFEKTWNAWMAQTLRPDHPASNDWVQLFSQYEMDDIRALAFELGRLIVDDQTVQGKGLPKSEIESWLSDFEGHVACLKPGREGSAKNNALAAIRSVYQNVLEGKEPSPAHYEAIKKLELSRENLSDGDKNALKRDRARALSLAQLNDKAMSALLQVVTPFLKKVREECRKNGVVPMDALLVLARNLLRDHPVARRDLKKRFDVFLVDEFQDTDPIQGEILFFLAERVDDAAKKWTEVRLGPARLFVVGDPKQSIYRFRGADIGAFQDFQARMKQQKASFRTLSVNFRSAGDLISAFNHGFQEILKDQPGLQSAYVPLSPWREKNKTPGLSIARFEWKGEGKSKADLYKKSEAEFIADQILDQVEKEGRPFSDFAVLFRSATPYEIYLKAFKERGVPYVSEGEKAFYKTNEATQFLNLLSTCADPEDRLSLAGALRSPYGGLTDDEILTLSLARQLDWRAKGVRLPKARRVFDLFRRLHAQSEQMPVSDFIDLVFQETPALEIMFQTAFGEQGVANLLKIRSLAETWTGGEPMTLKGFIRRFKAFRDDERAEGENPLADAKFNAVKVMTIHKSKGLEFPVVFLPNLFFKSARANKGAVLEKDWQTGRFGLRLSKAGLINGSMAWIEDQIRAREEAEERRVFYVALTRAKDHLVLLTRDDKGGPFAGLLAEGGFIPPEKETVLSMGSETFPVASVSVSTAPPKHVLPAERALGQAWNAERLGQKLDERARVFPEEGARPLFSSPTAHLMKEKEEKRAWRLPDGEEPRRSSQATILGELCHAVLEEWDFSQPSTSPLLEKGLNAASARLEVQKGFSPDDVLLNDARGVLESFLKSDWVKKMAGRAGLKREAPFLYRRTNGETLRGAIDLLYEENGTLIIADYKTNQVKPGEEPEKAKEYATQGKLYQEAIKTILGREALFELVFLRTGKAIRL